MAAVERWFVWLDLVMVHVAVVAVAAMMLLTSADATSRYLLNRPILGAYEITEKYLMVAAIFLGLSYAYRGGALVRVTFLVERLPRAMRQIADHAAHLVTFACCLVFVVASGQQALRALADETSLTTIDIPVGPSYLLVPLGFLVMTVLMLIDLPRVRTRRAYLFSQGAPSS
jgi:TRAP-type C4-dicarboxylate transport system permease small subunit